MRPTYHRPLGVRGRSGAARRAAAAAAALLAVAGFQAGAAGGATPAPPPVQTLVIEGTGNGHGVGMSQEGAMGYARHGYAYAQILAHYYTGTTLALAPAKAVVKVLIGSKVKKMPLERYVRGVIGAEMPPSAPAAALEAQAVASRTYALTDHAGGTRFDVYSDTRRRSIAGRLPKRPPPTPR